MIKRYWWIVLIAALICTVTLSIEAQRPTGQAVAGATASGTAPITIQTDANGVVAVSGTVTTTLCSTGTCSENVQIVDGPYVTTYTSGATATVLSTTAGTVLTASAVLVQHLRCWNQTSSAATVTVTDTAGVNIVPPAFSIPALSAAAFIDSVIGEEYTGIKWSAGTASAILCKVRGKS